MKQDIHVWYDQEGDFLELCIGKPAASYAEDVMSNVFVRFDENTHQIKSIGILNVSKTSQISIPLINLNLSYDRSADTLDFSFGQDNDVSFENAGDNLFQRIDRKTGCTTGLRIVHLTESKKKFIDRHLSSFEIPQIMSPRL